VARLRCGMEISARIQCPYCGQSFEVVVDTSEASPTFTTDCEVCCRPIQVSATCRPGRILHLDTEAD
jgi:hypothetical protein